MNILHVSLGLPPLRTGGLTRYCTELMEAQVASGDNVSLLFPGPFLPGKVRFKKGNWRGVTTYELVNPLPVALTYGIAEPDAFTVVCKEDAVFGRLLGDASPDVVHVHSYMGIYWEFFQAVKASGIPMVFTTHDYYPMCPRCTLIDAWGSNCTKEGSAAEACAACCRGGMSLKKSIVMQSRLYAQLKSSFLYNKLASVVKRDMASKSKDAAEGVIKKENTSDYQHLLDYNKSIFMLFDLVLTNSKMTERTYRKTFIDASYRSIRITHAGLTFDNRGEQSREACDSPLIIGYFGGRKEYKGYETLVAASRILHNENIKFELRLFGDDYSDENTVAEARCFGRVPYDEMNAALRELDLVVVPSIYRETFGFVVLEALCAGTAVICSDAVGASDLLEEDAIFQAGNPDSLVERIKAKIAGKMHSQSVPQDYPLSMEQQVCEMRASYKNVIERVRRG